MSAVFVLRLSLTLIAANFLYQAMTGLDWIVATERSYFQLMALGIAYLLSPATEREPENTRQGRKA